MTVRCGTYVGTSRPALRGKHAIVMHTDTPGIVQAQFDDPATGLAYGWHRFFEGSFKYDPEIDWSRDTHEEWRELNTCQDT